MDQEIPKVLTYFFVLKKKKRKKPITHTGKIILSKIHFKTVLIRFRLFLIKRNNYF